MWMITDDPLRDFGNYEAEQEERRARVRACLPRCCECEERITDESCFEIDGNLICPDCLYDNHRRDTEDFIDEI